MWSLGVVITALFVALAGLYAASTATNASLSPTNRPTIITHTPAGTQTTPARVHLTEVLRRSERTHTLRLPKAPVARSTALLAFWCARALG